MWLYICVFFPLWEEFKYIREYYNISAGIWKGGTLQWRRKVRKQRPALRGWNWPSKSRQRTLDCTLGLVWGHGAQTWNALEGSWVYVLVKLSELDLTLWASMRCRETELVGCRLHKALFTSNTKWIHLRARCSLGNRGRLLQIMKGRRHVCIRWMMARKLILHLNSLGEVICQQVIDKTSVSPDWLGSPGCLKIFLRR